MKTNVTFLLCLLIASLLACRRQSTDPSIDNGDLIYSNSFESQSDTVGWTGYGGLQLFPSAPPGGGIQSARISGGCVVPHASAKVRTIMEGGTIRLQCWGKNLAIGGTVELYKANDPRARISIQITDTVWTFYRSESTLTCSANEMLELVMYSGGIVYSAMLVDRIEIHRVR